MDIPENFKQTINDFTSDINNTFPEIKTIGLCHSVQGTAEMLARDLGENIEDIDYLCAGINHMAFYKKFEKISNDGKNEDLYPRLKNLADKGKRR